MDTGSENTEKNMNKLTHYIKHRNTLILAASISLSLVHLTEQGKIPLYLSILLLIVFFVAPSPRQFITIVK